MNELILSKLDVAEASVDVMHGKMFAFTHMVDPIEPALTAVTLTSDQVDADPTLTNNAIHTSAFDGNEAVDMTLPAATVGSYVIYRQSAEADEANAIDFICAGTDTFEANQIVEIGNIAAQSDVSAGDDVKLIITPTTANNAWGLAGSQVHFFCRQAGKWLVKVSCPKEGTGAACALEFA